MSWDLMRRTSCLTTSWVKLHFPTNPVNNRTRLALRASFVFLCLLLFGCQDQTVREHIKLTGHTMGTHYNITLSAVAGEPLQADTQALQEAVDAEFRYLTQVFSISIEDSGWMELNRAEIGQRSEE